MTENNSLKSQLEIKLAGLKTELSTIANYDEGSDDWQAIPDTAELNEADENAEADAVEEWNERRGTVSALETEYRDTKRALSKIAAGTYGHCEICQGAIEPERLAFKPTARTCIAHINEEASLTL